MKRIAFTLLLLLSISSALFAQTLRNGSGNGLNLRSEASTNSSVVKSIPPNAKVSVVDKSNSEWYKVSYDGTTGYVSSKYLTEENKPNNNNNNNSNNNQNNRNSNSFQRKSNAGKAAAVSYNTGIGVRFGGWESGLTIKHFIKSNAAIEGILSSGWRYRGTRITGLYEIQKDINGAPGLYWFYGVGAHLGFYNRDYWDGNSDCQNGYYYHKGIRYRCDGTRTTVGIDGIIGLEYLFSEIPFTIGLDLKPSIDIIGWGGNFWDLAFTARYAF